MYTLVIIIHFFYPYITPPPGAVTPTYQPVEIIKTTGTADYKSLLDCQTAQKAMAQQSMQERRITSYCVQK